VPTKPSTENRKHSSTLLHRLTTTGHISFRLGSICDHQGPYQVRQLQPHAAQIGGPLCPWVLVCLQPHRCHKPPSLMPPSCTLQINQNPAPLNPTVNTTLATMVPYPLFDTKLSQNQSLAKQIKPRPFKSCLAKITMMPLPFCLHRNPANKKPKPFTGFLMDERKINEKKKLYLSFSFYYFLCCMSGYGTDGKQK
jgi:hypothetical protein